MEKAGYTTDKKTGKKLQLGRIAFIPWTFEGLGGKPGEEYWVLGA